METITLTKEEILSFLQDKERLKQLLELLHYGGTSAIWATQYVTNIIDQRVLQDGFVVTIDDDISQMDIVFSNKLEKCFSYYDNNNNNNKHSFEYQLWIEVMDGCRIKPITYYTSKSIIFKDFKKLFETTKRKAERSKGRQSQNKI